jgi:hypothetical protein
MRGFELENRASTLSLSSLGEERGTDFGAGVKLRPSFPWLFFLLEKRTALA